jgi:hypothetical protein
VIVLELAPGGARVYAAAVLGEAFVDENSEVLLNNHGDAGTEGVS